MKNITPKQQQKNNEIDNLRELLLATPNAKENTYRIALKVLLESADYTSFLNKPREPEPFLPAMQNTSKLIDNRTNKKMAYKLMSEKTYIYYALRGHVTTGRDLPTEVIEKCKRLDDMNPDNVLQRVLIMFAIYGPPPRSNAKIKSPLSEQRRLELLMRIRHYYAPIPTNPSIFVDESNCTIACKLEAQSKISVSTCKDPEEFRYVVQMLLQPRPL